MLPQTLPGPQPSPDPNTSEGGTVGGQGTSRNKGVEDSGGHLDSPTSLSHCTDEETEGRSCPRSSVREPGEQTGVQIHFVPCCLLTRPTHFPQDSACAPENKWSSALAQPGDMPEQGPAGWRIRQLPSAFQMKTSGEGDKRCPRWRKP